MTIFLMFLYIFNFHIIKGVQISESSLAVFLFLISYAVFCGKYRFMLQKSFLSKYNLKLLFFLLLCILIGICSNLLNSTNDFTYIKVLIHQIILAEIGVMLGTYIAFKKKNIMEIVIDSFFIQALIQLFCFISPTLLRATDCFRDEAIILKRDESYGGFRGLSISSSSFFGLAVCYVVVLVLLSFYWKKWEKKPLFKLVYLTIIIFGACSAGRTSIIGIGVFCLIRFMDIFRIHQIKLIQIFKIGFLCIGLSIIIALFYTNFSVRINEILKNNDAIKGFCEYFLQIVKSDSLNKSNNILMNSHSNRILFDKMYFKLNIHQLIFGDGRYTNIDGTYYLHTDAGYMRNILYFGLPGTLVLIIYQVFLLNYIKITKKKGFVSFVIFVSLMILEVKGQTMGFLLCSQSIIIVISSYCYILSKKPSYRIEISNCPQLISI